MRRGVRLAWLAVAIALIIAVAAAVVIGTQMRDTDPRVRDPRAYAVDSGEISLDKGLRRAEIRLPECLDKDLRYALTDDGYGYYKDIYMKLQAPEECMNRFLSENMMRDFLHQTGEIRGPDAEESLTYRPRWMDSDPVKQMGWQIGPEQRFEEFAVGKSNLYKVTALVQHAANARTVCAYVYAFRGG